MAWVWFRVTGGTEPAHGRRRQEAPPRGPHGPEAIHSAALPQPWVCEALAAHARVLPPRRLLPPPVQDRARSQVRVQGLRPRILAPDLPTRLPRSAPRAQCTSLRATDRRGDASPLLAHARRRLQDHPAQVPEAVEAPPDPRPQPASPTPLWLHARARRTGGLRDHTHEARDDPCRRGESQQAGRRSGCGCHSSGCPQGQPWPTQTRAAGVEGRAATRRQPTLPAARLRPTGSFARREERGARDGLQVELRD